MKIKLCKLNLICIVVEHIYNRAILHVLTIPTPSLLLLRDVAVNDNVTLSCGSQKKCLNQEFECK